MAQRSRPLGTIRQRADGRWEARLRTRLGERRSKYARTEDGARDALAQLIRDADQAMPGRRSIMTVGTWLDRWLGDADLAPRSRERYRYVIDGQLRPALGRAKLRELTALDVADMTRRMRERGSSPAAIRYAVAILSSALQVAWRQGLVPTNVARQVTTPEYQRAEIVPPTPAELAAIIEAADRTGPPSFGLMVRLSAETGLRQGEALGLTWAGVDLALGTVTVSQALRYGSQDLGRPKTRRSRRTVRVSQDLCQRLQLARRQQLAANVPTLFVFATRTGQAYNARNVLRWWHEACRAATGRTFRWHDMRHSVATRRLAAGESMTAVQALLGHTQVSTTVDIYGHVQAVDLAPLDLPV